MSRFFTARSILPALLIAFFLNSAGAEPADRTVTRAPARRGR